jgi:hypothetical protein
MYKINICVNSTKNFSEKTLPVIIPSLIESGVNPEQIYVFEGGNDIREVISNETHILIKTNHNSMEYTGLIDIVENEMDSDYWFNIHDTCKVGKTFWSLVNKIPESFPDKIALWRHPSMSIGSYKYEYLLKHKSRLIEIKNQDYSRETLQKWKQWGIHSEDYMLYKLNDSPTIVYNPELNLSSYDLKDEESWYDGVPRRIEYYPQLDLFKSKSNWDAKPWMEIDV